jgi:hypothetical protein
MAVFVGFVTLSPLVYKPYRESKLQGTLAEYGYEEVGNINAFRYTLAFAGDSVMVSVDERTGLVSTRFLGRRAKRHTMTR